MKSWFRIIPSILYLSFLLLFNHPSYLVFYQPHPHTLLHTTSQSTITNFYLTSLDSKTSTWITTTVSVLYRSTSPPFLLFTINLTPPVHRLYGPLTYLIETSTIVILDLYFSSPLFLPIDRQFQESFILTEPSSDCCPCYSTRNISHHIRLPWFWSDTL